MLYGDSEQMLECRILKNDEVVCSGETLTFSAYLVDVGEPEGGQKPLNDTSIHGRGKKVTKRTTSLHRNKFVNVSDCAEFKKNEMSRCGILQASPNSRTSSMTDGRFLSKAEEVSPGEMMEFPRHLVEVGHSEANHESLRDLNAWGNRFNSLHKLNMQRQQHNVTNVKSAFKGWQVLYTTQITQKAKKFHDGFLQHEVRRSLGRQVPLYDASRKVLENKFLSKDEVLGTGKSLVFDSHIVKLGNME